MTEDTIGQDQTNGTIAAPQMGGDEGPTSRLITRLKEKIGEGVLEAGYRLKEPELMEEHGVTRTVVRDALRTLDAEGYIQRSASQGFVVHVITLEDAEDIYQTREALEGQAAALFTVRATLDQKAQLREAIGRFGDVAARLVKLEEDLRESKVKPNGQLEAVKRELLGAKNHVYDVLLEGCGNKIVWQMLQSLKDRVSYLRKQTLSRSGRPMETLGELREMLDAIIAGDAKAAKEKAEYHVREAAKIAYNEIRRRSLEVSKLR